MLEINDGFTHIAIGTDPIDANQWRDPLTAARVPTGARVTLSFRCRAQLPHRDAVSLRYDLAENGFEREVQGVPRLSHTEVEGDQVFHHYRLAYWLPPHAVMRFQPRNEQKRPENSPAAFEDLPEIALAPGG